MLNICTLPGSLISGDSYELFSVKVSENSMQQSSPYCQSCFVGAEFLHSQVNRCATIRGGLTESVQRTVQYLNGVWITFCIRLYVTTAFLRCVASGYCDERAGIPIYCTVLEKSWTVWFKCYPVLKMSGIDGSLILYNNVSYCNISAMLGILKLSHNWIMLVQRRIDVFHCEWLHILSHWRSDLA